MQCGIILTDFMTRTERNSEMAIDYYAVGSRIRKLRLEKNITQEELAFDVNTSRIYQQH